MTVMAQETLVNGLRTEFEDTYHGIRNRQQDGRLGTLMDLDVQATNREHDFAYFDSAPHMGYWRRGDPIPTASFGSVKFNVPIFEWAMRVPWSKFDREDDQTGSLFTVAQQTGASSALLPERFFFDILSGTATTLPGLPNAPDGVSLFSATDSTGGARFGVSSGNLIGGGGLASAAAIRADYYKAIQQWKLMLDTKGQPLFLDDMVDGGVTIVHAAEKTEAFEEAFLQTRQSVVVGTDAGTTPSNLLLDTNRRITLWGSARLSGDDWYVFLNNSPKKAIFLMNRKGVISLSSLEGDNNGDHTRTTGEEYIQWEERSGAGVALPYGVIKINN